MQPSEAIADAESAFREGDYPRCVRSVHRLFMDDLTLFEAEAARYAGSVLVSDRSRFWTAPKDLYPKTDTVESIFDFIYARAVWGGGSGAGSDLSRTVLYVAYVQALMDRHDVRSVLDIGCGDWRFSRYLDFSGRNYTGFDVVSSVIAANRTAFGASNIQFEQADLSTHPGFAPCDLILCKDVLQHLSNARVSAILSKCGGARLALITNDYHPGNSDCRDGETRPLDVTAPPFGFPARPVLRFGRKVSFLSERAGSISPPRVQ
jgi:SAM-dependent methyltransferase